MGTMKFHKTRIINHVKNAETRKLQEKPKILTKPFRPFCENTLLLMFMSCLIKTVRY